MNHQVHNQRSRLILPRAPLPPSKYFNSNTCQTKLSAPGENLVKHGSSSPTKELRSRVNVCSTFLTNNHHPIFPSQCNANPEQSTNSKEGKTVNKPICMKPIEMQSMMGEHSAGNTNFRKKIEEEPGIIEQGMPDENSLYVKKCGFSDQESLKRSWKRKLEDLSNGKTQTEAQIKKHRGEMKNNSNLAEHSEEANLNQETFEKLVTGTGFDKFENNLEEDDVELQSLDVQEKLKALDVSGKRKDLNEEASYDKSSRELPNSTSYDIVESQEHCSDAESEVFDDLFFKYSVQDVEEMCEGSTSPTFDCTLSLYLEDSAKKLKPGEATLHCSQTQEQGVSSEEIDPEFSEEAVSEVSTDSVSRADHNVETLKQDEAMFHCSETRDNTVEQDTSAKENYQVAEEIVSKDFTDNMNMRGEVVQDLEQDEAMLHCFGNQDSNVEEDVTSKGIQFSHLEQDVLLSKEVHEGSVQIVYKDSGDIVNKMGNDVSLKKNDYITLATISDSEGSHWQDPEAILQLDPLPSSTAQVCPNMRSGPQEVVEKSINCTSEMNSRLIAEISSGQVSKELDIDCSKETCVRSFSCNEVGTLLSEDVEYRGETSQNVFSVNEVLQLLSEDKNSKEEASGQSAISVNEAINLIREKCKQSIKKSVKLFEGMVKVGDANTESKEELSSRTNKRYAEAFPSKENDGAFELLSEMLETVDEELRKKRIEGNSGYDQTFNVEVKNQCAEVSTAEENGVNQSGMSGESPRALKSSEVLHSSAYDKLHSQVLVSKMVVRPSLPLNVVMNTAKPSEVCGLKVNVSSNLDFDNNFERQCDVSAELVDSSQSSKVVQKIVSKEPVLKVSDRTEVVGSEKCETEESMITEIEGCDEVLNKLAETESEVKRTSTFAVPDELESVESEQEHSTSTTTGKVSKTPETDEIVERSKMPQIEQEVDKTSEIRRVDYECRNLEAEEKEAERLCEMPMELEETDFKIESSKTSDIERVCDKSSKLAESQSDQGSEIRRADNETEKFESENEEFSQSFEEIDEPSIASEEADFEVEVSQSAESVNELENVESEEISQSSEGVSDLSIASEKANWKLEDSKTSDVENKIGEFERPKETKQGSEIIETECKNLVLERGGNTSSESGELEDEKISDIEIEVLKKPTEPQQSSEVRMEVYRFRNCVLEEEKVSQTFEGDSFRKFKEADFKVEAIKTSEIEEESMKLTESVLKLIPGFEEVEDESKDAEEASQMFEKVVEPPTENEEMECEVQETWKIRESQSDLSLEIGKTDNETENVGSEEEEVSQSSQEVDLLCIASAEVGFELKSNLSADSEDSEKHDEFEKLESEEVSQSSGEIGGSSVASEKTGFVDQNSESSQIENEESKKCVESDQSSEIRKADNQSENFKLSKEEVSQSSEGLDELPKEGEEQESELKTNDMSESIKLESNVSNSKVSKGPGEAKKDSETSGVEVAKSCETDVTIHSRTSVPDTYDDGDVEEAILQMVEDADLDDGSTLSLSDVSMSEEKEPSTLQNIAVKLSKNLEAEPILEASSELASQDSTIKNEMAPASSYHSLQTSAESDLTKDDNVLVAAGEKPCVEDKISAKDKSSFGQNKTSCFNDELSLTQNEPSSVQLKPPAAQDKPPCVTDELETLHELQEKAGVEVQNCEKKVNLNLSIEGSVNGRNHTESEERSLDSETGFVVENNLGNESKLNSSGEMDFADSETTAVFSKLLKSNRSHSPKHFLLDILARNLGISSNFKMVSKKSSKVFYKEDQFPDTPTANDVVIDSGSFEQSYVQNLLTRADLLGDLVLDKTSSNCSKKALNSSEGNPTQTAQSLLSTRGSPLVDDLIQKETNPGSFVRPKKRFFYIPSSNVCSREIPYVPREETSSKVRSEKRRKYSDKHIEGNNKGNARSSIYFMEQDEKGEKERAEASEDDTQSCMSDDDADFRLQLSSLDEDTPSTSPAETSRASDNIHSSSPNRNETCSKKDEIKTNDLSLSDSLRDEVSNLLSSCSESNETCVDLGRAIANERTMTLSPFKDCVAKITLDMTQAPNNGPSETLSRQNSQEKKSMDGKEEPGPSHSGDILKVSIDSDTGGSIPCLSKKRPSSSYGLRSSRTRKKKRRPGIFPETQAKNRRMSVTDLRSETQSPKNLLNLTKRPLEEYINSMEKVYRNSEKKSKTGRLAISMNDYASTSSSRGPEGDFLQLGGIDVMYEMVNKAYGESQLKRCRPTPRSLYLAAKQGNVHQVLVLAAGCNVNATIPQERHKTAMHAAAAAGHVDVLRILCMVGGNLSPLDTKLQTPLFDAVENQQTEVVKFLISQNVNVNLKDSQGVTVLHVAAQKANVDMIDLLMETRKLDINEQDNGGWTALMWTAESKRVDVARCLLRWGADVNILDSEQNTCLHWAALSGDTEIMELLLEANVHIDARNIFGATALHISARERKLPNLRILEKYRPNLDIINADGKKALELVRCNSKCYLQLKKMEMLTSLAKFTLKQRLITRDVARGQERRPIPCINEIDEETLPNDFVYISNNLECQSKSFCRTTTGCKCSYSCVNEKVCECAQLSDGKRFWYNETGRISKEIFEEDRPVVYECNMKCKCWSTCHQRVVQRGITAGLQLYKTLDKGWAVRTQALIPKGTFVCEYVGEVLTDKEANGRKDDCYLFDLDVKGQPTLFCLDAKFYGNITRFINHSCDPNILPVRVFTDHQVKSCPRIAFFAARDIKPYEEVCSNYGEKFWTVKKSEFKCVCKTSKCKYGAITVSNEQCK